MIKTFTGPMHSGKTAAMIATYNKIWNKEHVKCFKPNCDTRDIGVMKSKDYGDGVPSIGIDTFDEILDYVDDSVTTIFVDEAQLMQGNVSVLSYLSIVNDMDIYVGGLNQTSEQEPFLIMPQILAISDEIEVIKASCYDCGREAPYTYFEGEKTDAVLVGDAGYVPLCGRCLLKRRGSVETRKILILKKQAQKEEC